MQLKCPGCARTLKVPDTAAGKVVKCPCGKQLRIPASTGAATSASPGGASASPGASAAASSQPRVPAPQSARPATQANRRPAAAQPTRFGDESLEDLPDSDWTSIPSSPFSGSSSKTGKSAPNPYAASPNPYAASATPMGKSQAVDGASASRGQRFVNLLIDQFLMFIVSFAIGIVIGIASAISRGGGEMTPQESTQLGLIAQLAGLGATLLYYIIMEAVFGATIGKLCTGTRVVSVKGGRAGFGAIIGRTFARFIPFEPLSFLNSTASGWHDTLSGTRVIRVR